jgi:ABC-type phosphate/phosphonate transport system substrate-binding protein
MLAFKVLTYKQSGMKRFFAQKNTTGSHPTASALLCIGRADVYAVLSSGREAFSNLRYHDIPRD